MKRARMTQLADAMLRLCVCKVSVNIQYEVPFLMRDALFGLLRTGIACYSDVLVYLASVFHAKRRFFNGRWLRLDCELNST